MVAHLEAQGYRVWVDADGRDFLDLVTARSEEVGLVELKVSDYRTVRAQGVVRRALADWVAVALPSPRTARTLLQTLRGPVAPRLGVWVVHPDRVEELQSARPLEPPAPGTEAARARERFRALVREALEGRLPAGIAWGGVARATGNGKAYRLDEFGGGEGPAREPNSSATRAIE